MLLYYLGILSRDWLMLLYYLGNNMLLYYLGNNMLLYYLRNNMRLQLRICNLDLNKICPLLIAYTVCYDGDKQLLQRLW